MKVPFLFHDALSFLQGKLHFAASQDVAEVANLLTQDPSSASSQDAILALHVAASRGHEQIVSLLLAENAKLIEAVLYQKNCFHVAAERGHDLLMSQLLALRPDLIGSMSWDKTALHLAAREGHEKVVELLLAHKPDLINVHRSMPCTRPPDMGRGGSWRCCSRMTPSRFSNEALMNRPCCKSPSRRDTKRSCRSSWRIGPL